MYSLRPHPGENKTTKVTSPTHVDDPSVFLQNDCWSHVRRPSAHSSTSTQAKHLKNNNKVAVQRLQQRFKRPMHFSNVHNANTKENMF